MIGFNLNTSVLIGAMHLLALGVFQSVVGNALITLADEGAWGYMDVHGRLELSGFSSQRFLQIANCELNSQTPTHCELRRAP